jgi:hypothetical protein
MMKFRSADVRSKNTQKVGRSLGAACKKDDDDDMIIINGSFGPRKEMKESFQSA